MHRGPHAPRPLLFLALALPALLIGLTATAARADAQAPQPVPEGAAVIGAASATPVVVDTANVPGPADGVIVAAPAGYEGLVVLPPPPPPGYGLPAAAPRSAPAPTRDGREGRALRVLAETGGWLLGMVATVAASALVANRTDVVRDPSPLLLTFLTGYCVVMPLGAWLAGNALDGQGSLGWTIFGNALFSVVGAVLAYEITHDDALASPALTARLRGPQPPGLAATFTF